MKYLIALFALFFCVSVYGSQEEVVAAVIIKEAGGEGSKGMQAVANVIANRAAKGKTPYQVVTRPKQFECITPYLNKTDIFVARAKSHSRWNEALELSKKISNRSLVDITGGATHFHNLSMIPYWAKKIQFKTQIGGHRFYKE